MFKVIQGGNAKNLKEEHQTDEPCWIKSLKLLLWRFVKSKRQLKTTIMIHKTLGLQDRYQWLD